VAKPYRQLYRRGSIQSEDPPLVPAASVPTRSLVRRVYRYMYRAATALPEYESVPLMTKSSLNKRSALGRATLLERQEFSRLWAS